MVQNTKHEDILPINGIDYVQILASNSKQAAYYLQSAMGFQSFAYSGLETGNQDYESFVVAQDKIKIIITSPLHSGTAVGEHIEKHGDGVKVIAFWVDDAKKSFEDTVARGAIPYMHPKVTEDKDGEVVQAGIQTYGEVIHMFVERKNYNGVFLPTYKAWKTDYQSTPLGLKFIDHMVGNVELGEMDKWVTFYKDVLGFKQILSFDDKDISTEFTALMSKVMSNGDGKVKFPINEPAKGLKRSQVDEYLDFYESAGVQHIAMATDNIIETVSSMKKQGIEFLNVPMSYYDSLKDRVGKIDEEIEELSKLGILVDRDEDGYLLQIFTRPINPRPTMFFEIIQRKGATSFGKGNFKALFEAIEKEQAIRGTL